MRRPDLGIRLHLLDVADPEIADADTLRPAHLVQLLEREPQLLALLLAAARAVDQETIHIPAIGFLAADPVHAVATLLQRLGETPCGGEDLGRDEDVGARGHAGRRRLVVAAAHRGADFGLVAVELRRVDVAVADAEGGRARGDALRGRGLVDAEAEARDLRGAFGHVQLVGDGEFALGRHVGGGGVGGARGGGWRSLCRWM